MTADNKSNTIIRDKNMEVKVYSLTGKQLDVFSEVDPTTLKRSNTSVSFSTMGEAITITNAIVITRKPDTIF